MKLTDEECIKQINSIVDAWNGRVFYNVLLQAMMFNLNIVDSNNSVCYLEDERRKVSARLIKLIMADASLIWQNAFNGSIIVRAK